MKNFIRGRDYCTCTKMIEDPEAPLVPEIRQRSRPDDPPETDHESVREELDALRMEAPFVPMISKRRARRLEKRV